MDLDLHRKSSLNCRSGPYSPASYSIGTPPSFLESVRKELLEVSTTHPIFDTYNQAYENLLPEIDLGQISTFDEVASFVKSQVSQLKPELVLSLPMFSTRCRGAQAMYDSRKVSWLLDQIRRAAHHPVSLVSGVGEEVAAASQSPLANVDPRWLHELNGLPYAPPLPAGDDSTAPTTPPAISRMQKRKRKEPRRYVPKGEAPQPRQCPYCDQTFSGIASDQKSNLNRHIEHKHRHPGQPSAHVCPECGDDFGRSDYLLDHRREAHNLR
jgi:hypothetical protein